MTAPPPDVVAKLRQENARLQAELGAARDRQNASAEILAAIAGASGDAKQALQLIAETTGRLFGAPSVTIRLVEGSEWGPTINFGPSSMRIGAEVPAEQRRLGARNLPGTIVRENRQIHVPDLDNVDPSMADWPMMTARAAGTRTVAGTPLRREGKAIGALIVFRDRLAPFTAEELALQQSFADQAVIALENARLFNETQEALERQTATAEILKVIASSPSDVQPVFDAIAESAKRLSAGHSSTVTRVIGDMIHLAALTTGSDAGNKAVQSSFPTPLSSTGIHSRVARAGEIAFRTDMESEPDVTPAMKELARARGYRSILVVPMLRDGVSIGTISVTRRDPGPFADNVVNLLRTFADQAVIAIENVRLFNETQEALERQTATAEILKVIASSPSDVQPVFDVIVERAVRLCGARMGRVYRYDGAVIQMVAGHGLSVPGLGKVQQVFPRPAADDTIAGQVMLSHRPYFVTDIQRDDSVPALSRQMIEALGTRSQVTVPMLRTGEAIGAFTVGWAEPGAFSDQQVSLLQTFADQAVIAIENVRLFNETKEALERQTATAEILKVIASSPSDVQPVFEAIVGSAARLFEPCAATIVTLKDEKLHWQATTALHPSFDVERARTIYPLPFAPDQFPSARAIAERRIIEIPDSEASDTLDTPRRAGRISGFRSATFVPLVNDDQGIGVIILTHPQPGFRLSERHLALVQTFADQAVIAIQNTRLFNETKEALERQTATADILKVIASSPSDVQPVFEAIAERANRLVDGLSTAVYSLVDDTQHLMAFTRKDPEADATLQALFPRPLSALAWGEQIRNGEIFHISDTEVELSAQPSLLELARMRGFRSFLLVPLLRDRTPIGLISVTRAQPGTFVAHHVQLLQTFADQAVIAIENVRLFNETKEALERQTATADILKVIASSPSDVQPVFEAIATSSNRLVGGYATSVFRSVDDTLHLSALTPTNPTADAALKASFPRPLSTLPWSEETRNGEIVHVPDMETDPAVPENLRSVWRMRGFRGLLLVPLVRDRATIGMISVTRSEPGRFADHHVQLLQTFADQAVIAIENVRLFNETREALERQTATAEILKVIASSPDDVQPVFDAIAASANRLIGGFSSTVFRFIDGAAHLKAFTPTSPAADEVLRATFPRPVSDFPPFQMAQAGEVTQIPDTEALSDEILNISRARGYRSMLFAPLMNDDVSIGFIAVTRVQPGNFADHHVLLLRTFADQAVIAIENARLFNETKEALERQTATAEILKVIASSPDNVQPVFDAIATSSKQLIGAFSATVFRFVDGIVNLAAYTPVSPAADAVLKATFPRAAAGLPFFELAKGGKVVQEADSETNPDMAMRNIARARGFRSSLFSPLMNKETPIGLIVVTRKETGTFSEHHVQLLRTFADQAVIAIENVRLFDEVQAKTRDLTEALTYQTGSSNILSVIASSPTDVGPVLKAIVESACELCQAYDAVVLLKDGDDLRFSAHQGPIALKLEKFRISRSWVSGRAVTDRVPVHLHDVLSDEGAEFPEGQEHSRHDGFRSILSVPMLREGESIGAIALRRTEVDPFSDKQIALLQTFADQAVIAIGNVRLFDEVQAKTRNLSEALQQQTATAEVLKVISRSAFDLQTVLDALLASACRLCEADIGTIRYLDGDAFRLASTFGCRPEWIDHFSSYSAKPDRSSIFGRTIIEGSTVHIPDVLADPDYKRPDAQKLMGFRAAIGVPLVREGQTFGVINLFRFAVGSFNEKQIELVQTFADQAVIAIENVRLFDEVQAKTRDLSESLDQQTATSEVLEVISSSPGELEPVFQKMLENATRICGANFGTLSLYDGDLFRNVALYNVPEEFTEQLREPIRPHPKSGLSTVARTHQAIQIEDLRAQQPYLEGHPAVVAISDLAGARTIVLVPMLRENELVGTIAIYRQEVRSFTDKQVDLVANFAKQAVIAIENTRLLRELRERTEDLSESLQQQTATADVLKVISASPGELDPVFEAMLENAVRLCEARFAMLFLYEANEFRTVGKWNLPPAYGEFLGKNPIIPDPKIPLGRVVMTKQPVQIADVLADQSYIERFPGIVAVAELGGARTLLQVPMLKENQLVGTIGIYRQEVRPFGDKQIELVSNFAAQAVIAIENTRLLKELHRRTDDLSESLQQQTATANVLEVISRSAFDLSAVFETVAESSVKLCGSERALIFRFDGEVLQVAAAFNAPDDLRDWLERNPVRPGRNSVAARAALEHRTIQVPDVLADPEHTYGAKDVWPFRTVLAVPMLKGDDLLGVILVYHNEVREFTDKQIALVQTFADQAVIAIENTRLFEQVQERTKELSQSLDDLRTAQDRLVQTEKLASLGQLTAGIAHEIKNPLNFVNNFSALSAELTDELNAVLKPARLADDIREEVDELTGLLKDNLAKVVQHGRRADSIVKNMLLHSREGSGEHRPADVNALVDESLNLAYHGARAEKPQFNVTLQRNFDPNAGMIEAFPQEITRVFLNLISNGFYAVTKRKADNGGTGFEPVVSATTKDRGDQVEIRIRDNGTGIPAEVKEKMFNPFFTTKPAGEGTGLGLSMSHDIIVKQHGGTIDVDTAPGQFTEFRIVLPRTSIFSNRTRG